MVCGTLSGASPPSAWARAGDRRDHAQAASWGAAIRPALRPHLQGPVAGVLEQDVWAPGPRGLKIDEGAQLAGVPAVPQQYRGGTRLGGLAQGLGAAGS